MVQHQCQQISLQCSFIFLTGICHGTQLTNPRHKSQLRRAINFISAEQDRVPPHLNLESLWQLTSKTKWVGDKSNLLINAEWIRWQFSCWPWASYWPDSWSPESCKRKKFFSKMEKLLRSFLWEINFQKLDYFPARAKNARARRACTLRALRLLLADSALTLGRGKTFWRVGQVFFYENSHNSGTESKKIVPNVGKKPSLQRLKMGQRPKLGA